MDKKTVTAKELAERFEVSTRTIYRDIDTLSSAGIPVYTNKGKGGGISLLDDFVLNKSILSEQEQNEILTSLQSLNAFKLPDIEPVFRKMSLLFNKPGTNWIEVDFSHWGNDSKERDKFNLLRNAIINTMTISFDYYNSKGEKTARTVEPLKLVFKGQGWYLHGLCRIKNSFRIFKIRRMKNLELIGEVFQRTMPTDISDLVDESYENLMVALILRIDEKMAYRVYDEFEEEQICKNADRSFTVTVTLPEDEWVYGYIMSFGSYAEVVEPARIRKIISEELQASLKKYY